MRHALVAVLLLSSQLACENLGLDPSGELACAPPPQNACPKGFSCTAGLCWRNGTIDGSFDAPSGEARTETGDADDGRLDGNTTTDVAFTGDVVSEVSEATDVSIGDVQDVAPSDGKADSAPTCGVCPAPASNGHATCDGTSCSIACDSGYRNCSGTQSCIRNASCCGDSECPQNMPACVDGQCKARANDDPCSSDAECGSSHCAATAIGATTKVCCDSSCSGNCVDGCTGGTCQFKQFRTACGEIDNGSHAPRYFLCDGNGNCNPPEFTCGEHGNVCAASKDVVCCADPNNGYVLACEDVSTCAGQVVGDFEMSCVASIDCPAGTFCCSEQNQDDLFVTGCATSCLTFSTEGRDPTQYLHNQLCDLLRDPSCPAGKHCQTDPITEVAMCL